MLSDARERRIANLVGNRSSFETFVYTPLQEALEELGRRRKDLSLESQGLNLPLPLAQGPKAVLFRHIATPNYEIRRFLSIVDAIEDLSPLILEYTEDRFTNENPWKYSLGKIPFFKGRDSKGGLKLEKVNIIDFNASNGKPIASLTTLWGTPLTALHHALFEKAFPQSGEKKFDLSFWLKEHGPSAKEYYKPFLMMFIKHGILFENFLLEEPELSFNKEVILPALLEIEEETGLKPLIVSLEPTETEGSLFWLCHPHEDKAFVLEKRRG